MDETFHYSVSYPSHWFPSGNSYANAFEVRNYDPKNPLSVLERNRATVVIVDIVNDNAEATDSFLRSMLPDPKAAGQGNESLLIDGHWAVKIRRKVPVRPLSPGTSRASASGGEPVGGSPSYVLIATYIANGKHIVSIEGSAPADADPTVMEEITRIGQTVKFLKPRQPHR